MKTLIFGGTTEGRRLAELLSIHGIDTTLCVATEYGKNFVQSRAGLKVVAKRLNNIEMTSWLKTVAFNYVVDATHPYAKEATQNIKLACTETKTKYLRLIRQQNEKEREQSVIYVDNTAEAVKILNDTAGNVLMTIGSKELDAFTAINNYSERLYIRVIPMLESLQKAISLGFKNRNIICMQGPFDVDMNIATLKMANAAYMVTKASGNAGGFSQKLLAAAEYRCKVIVIAEPINETGYTFIEILRFFDIRNTESSEYFTYFPLFINFSGKKITVVGGGKIAERRIKVLLNYKADITVISPCITDTIYEKVQSGVVKYINKMYESMDVSSAFLIIAATNDREINRTVMKDANKAGRFVIVSDNRDDCNCYFPAIAESDEYIVGIVSKNGNHTSLREKARKLRRWIKHEEGC